VENQTNSLPYIYLPLYKAMENYRIFPQFPQVPVIYTDYTLFFNYFYYFTLISFIVRLRLSMVESREGSVMNLFWIFSIEYITVV